MKPHITCYRSAGELWWQCYDPITKQYAWARTPYGAWESWNNRSIYF